MACTGSAGSPGPLDSMMPSGARAATSSAVEEGGHHRHLAAPAHQAADDVPLAAVIHQHDVGAALGVVHLGLGAGDVLDRIGDGIGPHLVQQRLGAVGVGRVGGVEPGQDGAVHDALSRMIRVRRRVSMPSMPMIPFRFKKLSSVSSLRQLEGVVQASRTM